MTRIILRNDTSNNWTTNNPVLALGEAGVESNSGKLKLGDGATAWNDLPYVGGDKLTGSSPLKVENGVISLEIDGQTIQVNQQGQLACNLDEIGNDLTTKANTDLSNLTDAGIQVIKDNAGGGSEPVDAYTKAETDTLLVGKEDKITAVEPLSLEETAVSNLNGWTYNDETHITANNNTGTSYSSDRNFLDHLKYYTAGGIGDNRIGKSYITMPFHFGYIYKMPMGNDANLPIFLLGKLGTDGVFDPIFINGLNVDRTPSLGTSYRMKCIKANQTPTLTDGTSYGIVTYPTSSFLRMGNGGAKSVSTTNATSYGYELGTAYFQLCEHTNVRTFSCQNRYVNLSNTVFGGTMAGADNVSDEVWERMHEITHVVFIPSGEAFDNIDINKFAIYDAPTSRLGWSTSDLQNFIGSLGNQVFDIKEVSLKNYLQLTVGDDLSVVDGKLTVSQTITGKKTFTEMASFNSGLLCVNNPNFGGGYLGIQGSKGYANTIMGGDIGITIRCLDNTNRTAPMIGYTFSGKNAELKTDSGVDFFSTANIGNYVDGTTITFDTNVNKLVVTGGGSGGGDGTAPLNMVTTDTDQTITGRKVFSSDIEAPNVVDTQNDQTIQGKKTFTDEAAFGKGIICKPVLNYGGGFISLQGIKGYANSILGTDAGFVVNATDVSNTRPVTTRYNISGQSANIETDGGVKFLNSENVADYVDGTTITYDATTKKLSSVGGGGTSTASEKYGIRGDYSTHYGILDCPNGLITYSATGKDITLSAGVVLQCAGSDIKTTIASAMSKSLTSTAPITLFYAGGELLECGTVDYSESEPADNGVENYQAWFKPSEQKWYFKSNDTGNVFRTLVATPLANINIVDGNITRVDYIGYRVLDDDIILNTSNAFKQFKLTQAEYDALTTKDESTMYVIVG